MPTVSGRVVFDIDRNINIANNVVGIESIPVALQNTLSHERLVVLTNALGEYSFINVPAGSYRIVESYGLSGGVPTPGDFVAAVVDTIPTAQTPPIALIPTAPIGATDVDCVTPNTVLITVGAADIVDQYIFNGPVAYTPLNHLLDACTMIFPTNLITGADSGTFGAFTSGTIANSGPAVNPYPALFPDFTYVVPDPSKYTPIDGEFTIQNIMNDAMSNQIGAWWRIADHTSGNETGRMLIVNENDPGDVIFRVTAFVSSNTNYLFSAWILNLFRVAGYPGPDFAVRVLDEEDNVLYESPLGFEIPVSAQFPEWKEIGAVINSRENAELTFEFFSQGEATIGNDFAIDDITLREVLLPQFLLIKSEDKNMAAIGELVTYTLTLTNTCEQPLTNVHFRDYIPESLTFVPGSVIVNGVVNSAANPLVGFFVPDIPGGTSLEIIFSVQVTSAPAQNPVINRATLRYVYTPIPNGIADIYTVDSNEVALLIDIPATDADLSISKAVNRCSAHRRESLVYRIVVTNRGPGDAENVLITDQLPKGLVSPQLSVDGGNSWNPWIGEHAIASLPNGESITLLIRTIVSTNACGSLENFAHVTSSTPDPNPQNNRACASTSVCVSSRCTQNCCGCSHC